MAKRHRILSLDDHESIGEMLYVAQTLLAAAHTIASQAYSTTALKPLAWLCQSGGPIDKVKSLLDDRLFAEARWRDDPPDTNLCAVYYGVKARLDAAQQHQSTTRKASPAALRALVLMQAESHFVHGDSGEVAWLEDAVRQRFQCDEAEWLISTATLQQHGMLLSATLPPEAAIQHTAECDIGRALVQDGTLTGITAPGVVWLAERYAVRE